MKPIKNLSAYICVVLLAAATASCGDFLDVKPVGKTTPTTAAELDRLLDNSTTAEMIFTDNNTGLSFAMLSDNFYISQSQKTESYPSGSNVIDRYAAYTFYDVIFNPAATPYLWTNGYKGVNIFNTVVEEMDDLSRSERESDLALKAVAQAKAGRAWWYMYAGLMYGPMWNPAGENDTRTIPYRTYSVPVHANPDLATTAEVFEYALGDMTDALADTPNYVPNPHRATKAAVHAMIAQLYMYQRNWPKMLEHADLAWTISLEQKGGDTDMMFYDYNLFYYDNYPAEVPEGQAPEVGATLRYHGDGDFANSFNREVLLARRSATGQGKAYYYCSQEFIDLFDDDDLRARLFLLDTSPSFEEDGIRKVYYRHNWSKIFPNGGLSYPMLLLMRAEAYARTGSVGKALADLNLLRRYRYEHDGTPGSWNLSGGESMSADELLHEIVRERRRELPIESVENTLDIKRYYYDTGKPWRRTSIVHYVGTKAYTWDLDSRDQVLNITNATIGYNPHWGLKPFTGTYAPSAN